MTRFRYTDGNAYLYGGKIIVRDDDDIDGVEVSHGSIYAPGEHPSLSWVGKVAAGNQPSYIEVAGRYLYVTAFNDNKVHVYDIDSPLSPTLVGSVTTDDGPTECRLRGKYLYVLTQNDGTFQSIDVSDPTAPTVADTLTVLQGQRFALNGRYALTGGPEDTADANKYTVIDTAVPTVLAEEAVAAAGVGTVQRGIAPLFDDYFAIASRDTNTLYIIDISTPGTPTTAGSLAGLTQTLTPLANRDPYIYAAGYGSGKFYVIDCSDPTAPLKAGECTTTVNAEDIRLSGRYAYVACRDTETLEIIDVANPASPEVVETVTGFATTNVRSVAVAGPCLYCVSQESPVGFLHTFKLRGSKTFLPAN